MVGTVHWAKHRRQAVVSAFLSLLEERGYEATTLDEIARRTGLTKSLVAYYSRGKLDLLARVVSRIASQRSAWAIESHTQAGNPREGLMRFLEGQLDIACKPGVTHAWLTGLTASPRDAGLRQTLADGMTATRQALERLAGALPDDVDAAALVIGLRAMLEGAFVLVGARHEGLPPQEVFDGVLRTARMLLDHASQDGCARLETSGCTAPPATAAP